MHANKASWVFLHRITIFLFYCTSAYNKKQVTQQHKWITTGLLIFKSQLVQKHKMFFLLFSKGHGINQVLKHSPLTHTVANTLSSLLRMQRHPVLSHCSTTVWLKSQAGLLETCWSIWNVRWEHQTYNLLSGQLASSEDSGKQFVSGPIHYGGNFLHWFPAWQLVRMLSFESPRDMYLTYEE